MSYNLGDGVSDFDTEPAETDDLVRNCGECDVEAPVAVTYWTDRGGYHEIFVCPEGHENDTVR